jgi:hypothetical protein
VYHHLHKNKQIQEVDYNNAAVHDKKTNMACKRKCDDNEVTVTKYMPKSIEYIMKWSGELKNSITVTIDQGRTKQM